MNTTITNKKYHGSALILVVALVTLIAAIGTLFMMSMRLDHTAAISVSESKQLDAAVGSAVAKVAEQLYRDMDINTGSYYDYPDDNNPWLANLEPYDDGGTYRWRQISDVTGYISTRMTHGSNQWDNYARQDVTARPVEEYERIELDIDGQIVQDSAHADADGDGISDSKWVPLDGVTADGQQVYAAIRVIDHGGMLNVNTGYVFDPEEGHRSRIDGRSPTQINLVALAERGSNPNAENQLMEMRSGGDTPDISDYESSVVWRYRNPQQGYTPFDISDELELRYRYFLRKRNPFARIQDNERFWTSAYRMMGPSVPRDNVNDWFDYVNLDPSVPDSNDYDYRHISTTYNMDRVIAPDGEKQINVNQMRYWDNPVQLRNAYERLVNDYINDERLASESDQREELAQILVNMKDYVDRDARVTVFNNPDTNSDHYGFDRPLIFISEIARTSRVMTDGEGDPVLDEDGEEIVRGSFGMEFYKIYGNEDWDDMDFEARIVNPSPEYMGADSFYLTHEDFASRGGRFFVQLWEDPQGAFERRPEYSNMPWDGATGVDPNVPLRWDRAYSETDYYNIYFASDNPDDPQITRDEFADADPDSPFFWASIPAVGDSESFDPTGGPLDTNTTYYLRIDEYKSSDEPGEDDIRLYTGPVIGFTTWDEPPDDVRPETIGSIVELPVDEGSRIEIWRRVDGAPDMLVDEIDMMDAPEHFFDYGTTRTERRGTRSWQREIRWGQVLKRIWESWIEEDEDSRRTRHNLGHTNSFELSAEDSEPIQLHRPGRDLWTLGEIGKVFKVNPLVDFDEIKTEHGIMDNRDIRERHFRVDVASRNIHNILPFLTRISHPTDPNETMIPGRININTAPWYVIAQLPWVSQRDDDNFSQSNRYALAKGITAYRDDPNNYRTQIVSQDNQDNIENAFDNEIGTIEDYDVRMTPGFASIGELNHVIIRGAIDGEPATDAASIRYYALDGEDQYRFPDITVGRDGYDGYPDDFEERDLIFHRISDLVTVRSDVFTAYILVRLGTDGPQKRAIAILDRSNVQPIVNDAGEQIEVRGNVEILALQPVPDPR